ncbi:alpha/beta hydrolase [Natrialba asiatica]|uniref:Phospholipase/carboxylesterase n=1 Tax=Natrialba asiatica (strain ATCC 700177 / DSM 12278 / JCM 9576 / FERM P-10747 / NBRC 102637 / 172P1) TaxID=29540 RepID=M0AKL4_NATA1|nr:dienelactone hydrolase family protein [Natrialba asiatica]ELY97923.1 phospholipase/carboxylesterase [Natrialba asiatica DSM 12278]
MSDASDVSDGPHQDQPLVTAGTELGDATAAMILVHGRGATARSIVQMGREVHREGVALLAPQAERNEWYPNSFLAPVESNEPGRSSGLQAIRNAIETATDAGIPTERILVLGFSQGACLASEFVARNPRRYGGLVALSGGLIGDEIEADDYADTDGDLDGTPAFLGCSDVDPHIPEERVHETARVLEELNADVTERIYEGMGHGVNEDELETVAELVAELVSGSR